MTTSHPALVPLPARDEHSPIDSTAHPAPAHSERHSDGSDAGPTRRSGEWALRRRLEDEWQEMRVRHDGLALQWAREAPVMEGCRTLDDVVRACRDHDAAALFVLGRAQGGCPVAGRCLLQVLLPLLAGLARRDRRADLADYLGACWPVAMTRSPDRTTSILAGIALDTRRALVRERAGLWLATSADADTLAGVPDVRFDGPGEDAPVSAEGVVSAARRLRLVPPASADVLRSVYVEGLSGREAATRHGISAEMVRYRCSSAVRRLRAHREVLLDDPAG